MLRRFGGELACLALALMLLAGCLDQQALRSAMIRHVGQSGLDLFGVSLNDKVHSGTGGQLFYTGDFTMPCPYVDRFNAQAVKARLDRWQRIAALHGKQLMVTIAPDKSSIHRTRLGVRGGALMQCSDQIREEVVDTWGSAGDGTLLLLWDDLTAIEDGHPGTTYQPGDTHWTEVGAAVLLRRLLASTGVDGYEAELTAGEPSARPGDLYRMLGFHRSDLTPTFDVRRAPGAARVPGRTLVIHDSFGTALEPLLEPYFADVTYLHWKDLVARVKAGRPLPAFDRVVIETVERSFAQRALDVLADPKVEAALLRGLTAGR
jgi:hypothetical protein